MKEKKCAYCGQPFMPRSNSQKYCDGPHFAFCKICGKKMKINVVQIADNVSTCSNECKQELIKQTSLVRYGISSPGNNEDARMQAKNTMMKRYGGSTTLQSATLMNKFKQSMLAKYGTGNPAGVSELVDKRVHTRKLRHPKRILPTAEIYILSESAATDYFDKSVVRSAESHCTKAVIIGLLDRNQIAGAIWLKLVGSRWWVDRFKISAGYVVDEVLVNITNFVYSLIEDEELNLIISSDILLDRDLFEITRIIPSEDDRIVSLKIRGQFVYES